jgi:hypothetical protein
MDDHSAPSPHPDDVTLRLEYEKAQDSAEHHNNLAWAAIGIFLPAIAALFAFATTNHATMKPYWLVPAAGICLTFLFVYIFEGLANVMRQKYERCKQIEAQMGMQQHSNVKMRLRARPAIWLFCVLVIIAWVYLITLGGAPPVTPGSDFPFQ